MEIILALAIGVLGGSLTSAIVGYLFLRAVLGEDSPDHRREKAAVHESA